MSDLRDKVVLGTGGSSGIGAAAAHAFVHAGGAEARFIRADMAQGDDVERLVAETVAAYGRLDAAFNNGGAIVNTSSVNGLGGAAGGALYSAA
jgi:NAD(P)-dependent dehydrogenase (short-subunit alcohol dehydrogenase family)